MQIHMDFWHYLPDEPIFDPESGLPLNTPVSLLYWPWWWEDQPENYARILEAREELGIEIDDWLGEEKPERDPNARPIVMDIAGFVSKLF